MTQTCIGCDVGGAHLKAVLIDVKGHVLAAKQVYCPLWRGLHELQLAIDTVLLDFNANQHTVTMTGELADIFANRREGVLQIADTLALKLTGRVRYYAGNHGFVNVDRVEQHTTDIASMNWLASVQYVAHKVQKALFIDIGSTTTDIALINSAMPLVRGFTDASRMQCDGLVYTGVVRTPLMALAQKIHFSGQMTNVAAEHFATTADVYTLTGDLTSAENMAETADGAEKSLQASACRIARMIGCDAQDAPITSWEQLAYAFKQAQLSQIKQAVLSQLSLLQDCSGLRIVGAGAGSFLVAELAQQLGFDYMAVTELISSDDNDIKIMANRVDNKVSITLCVPQIAKFVKNVNIYKNNEKQVINLVNKISTEYISSKHISVYLNTRDDFRTNELYLTAIGSSIESGDEGLVGRGNRINGLISNNRPMSMEGACGKNPIYHVGKLYNLCALNIAQKIYLMTDSYTEVFLVSQSGQDLLRPWKVVVKLESNNFSEKELKPVVIKELNSIPNITKMLLAGKVKLC